MLTKTAILVIGVVRKGDCVLLRKKPDGSPPYKETWYLFGGEVSPESPDPETALRLALKKQAGIEISIVKRIGWDSETKPDHQGEQTFFIYLDCLCEYISGELVPSEGIERLEWVPTAELPNYDLVPPSRKLFRRIGLL